jgi:hypothetical protein
MTVASVSPSHEEAHMTCDTCDRLNGILVESIVFADKAETALRCFFITHQHLATVSDIDEYNALRHEQQHTADGRHRAFMDMVTHAVNHADSRETVSTQPR